MTEGQWLWIMIHMALDNEEQLERMCYRCKERSSENRCMGCGDKLILERENNPNFDDELFEKLKKRAE